MDGIAIRTKDLTIDFGRSRALDSVSMEVPAGIVFGFLGPNGAGKTTMIRLLLGLLEPTSGEANVLDFDVRAEPDRIRDRTGALLEYAGLYERLSAEDNLEFYGRVWHMQSAERRSRIQELLNHVGLWERRKERVGTWSRGMKQKLAVARALLHRPALVFLDEPTAGLDPVAAASLREDLAALSTRERVTVFLTTHNLAEAEKLCQRVAVIREGKLLAVGHPGDLRAGNGPRRAEIVGRGFGEQALALLRARPEVVGVQVKPDRLVIDVRGEAAVAPLVNLMVGAGVEIEEVRRDTASLEEVFLSLMEAER